MGREPVTPRRARISRASPVGCLLRPERVSVNQTQGEKAMRSSSVWRCEDRNVTSETANRQHDGKLPPSYRGGFSSRLHFTVYQKTHHHDHNNKNSIRCDSFVNNLPRESRARRARIKLPHLGIGEIQGGVTAVLTGGVAMSAHWSCGAEEGQRSQKQTSTLMLRSNRLAVTSRSSLMRAVCDVHPDVLGVYADVWYVCERPPGGAAPSCDTAAVQMLRK